MRRIDWSWSVATLLLSLAACTPSAEPDDSLATLSRWSISAEPSAVLADDGTPAR